VFLLHVRLWLFLYASDTSLCGSCNCRAALHLEKETEPLVPSSSDIPSRIDATCSSEQLDIASFSHFGDRQFVCIAKPFGISICTSEIKIFYI
jgi:hypothetical protein